MVISNYNSLRVLFDKIASVYFIWKCQPREPALYDCTGTLSVPIVTAAEIYSLGYGLHTFTAVPRSTQPSILCRTVKWVSVYKASNNNNDDGDVDGSGRFSADSQPKSTGLVRGLAATRRSVYIHQMNQTNSRNNFAHDDSTINIAVIIINTAGCSQTVTIVELCWPSCSRQRWQRRSSKRRSMLTEVWTWCAKTWWTKAAGHRRHVTSTVYILQHTSLESCTHTHTRLTALFPGLPGTRKAKPICFLLKQETVSGSGISWAICKSAPCSREITMPAPNHSVFYRPDALPATQPTASKHGRPSVESCMQTKTCPHPQPSPLSLFPSPQGWHTSGHPQDFRCSCCRAKL